MTEPSTVWLDDNGDPCDEADAASVEIQAYDDQGVPDTRVYADLNATPRLELSDDPDDALVVSPAVTDAMAKSSWDLWGHDADGKLVLATTVPLLLDALGVTGQPLAAQRSAVGHLITLPAWAACPPALHTAVAEWLEGSRPS